MNSKELNLLIGQLEHIKFNDEEEGWGEFIKFISERFYCEAASYFLIDESKKIISFSKAIGPNSEDLIGVSFGYTGIVGWCAEYKKNLFVRNTKDHPLFTKKVDNVTKFETKSVMCFCCFLGDKLNGIIEFINPKNKDMFDEDDFENVLILTNFMSKKIYINKLEITINKLNEKAQSTINNLSGGFIGVDLEGKIMFFNPKAIEILEVKENYIGRNYEDLNIISTEIVSAIKQVLIENKILKRQEFFYDVNGKNKRIGYSTMNIKAVDGTITGAGIIFQDITEVK